MMLTQRFKNKLKRWFILMANISGVLVVISFVWTEPTFWSLMWLASLLIASAIRTGRNF